MTTSAALLFAALGSVTDKPAAARTLPQASLALHTVPAGRDLRFASLRDVEGQLQRLRNGRRLKRPLPGSLPSQVRERAYAYRPLVEQYAEQYGLPPALILAIIERESMFDPQARSAANAVGLMQIIPEHAGRAAGRYAQPLHEMPTEIDLLDPETNIHYGTAYVRLLMDRHFQDVANPEVRVAVVLAAYNWGPGNMRQSLERGGMPASLTDLEVLLEGHAPAETRQFVREITRRMPAYS